MTQCKEGESLRPQEFDPSIPSLVEKSHVGFDKAVASCTTPTFPPGWGLVSLQRKGQKCNFGFISGLSVTKALLSSLNRQ